MPLVLEGTELEGKLKEVLFKRKAMCEDSSLVYMLSISLQSMYLKSKMSENTAGLLSASEEFQPLLLLIRHQRRPQ